MSIFEEDLLILISLGRMEMAYKENDPVEINQNASLLMEQVRKKFSTKDEQQALLEFTKNGRNRDIIYRYYSCLDDKEKAGCYYDSLWDTPFVISKYIF